jgi:hypothetical protein
VRQATAALALLLAFAAAAEPLAAGLSREEARDAALKVGESLKNSDLPTLRHFLPSQGKVRLNLVCLGPVEGFFSASQVEALLGEFLEQGSIRSFDLLTMEFDPRRYAMVHGRAFLTDKQGHPARVDLHLAFQPEDERWVLREIRETRP